MRRDFISIFYEYQISERVRDIEGGGFYKRKVWKAGEIETTKGNADNVIDRLSGLYNVRNISVIGF